MRSINVSCVAPFGILFFKSKYQLSLVQERLLTNVSFMNKSWNESNEEKPQSFHFQGFDQDDETEAEVKRFFNSLDRSRPLTKKSLKNVSLETVALQFPLSVFTGINIWHGLKLHQVTSQIEAHFCIFEWKSAIMRCLLKFLAYHYPCLIEQILLQPTVKRCLKSTDVITWVILFRPAGAYSSTVAIYKSMSADQTYRYQCPNLIETLQFKDYIKSCSVFCFETKNYFGWMV